MKILLKNLFIILLAKVALMDIVKEDVQFLNELPLDKLLRLKSSIKQLVTTELDALENVTTTTPTYHSFGAEALAVQAPPPKTPIRRGDYEEGWHKGGGHSSKISNIFSMSVTTLAFLAFGGYLLCLIVHAVRHKHMYYNTMLAAPTTVQPATFFVSAGIKKRPQPQPQFSSYGRKRREAREARMREIDLPPEQLFSALLQLCEGYAKWSGKFGNETYVE